MPEPFAMTYRRSIDILAHAGIDINQVRIPGFGAIWLAGEIWNGWQVDYLSRDLIREVPEKED